MGYLIFFTLTLLLSPVALQASDLTDEHVQGKPSASTLIERIDDYCLKKAAQEDNDLLKSLPVAVLQQIVEICELRPQGGKVYLQLLQIFNTEPLKSWKSPNKPQKDYIKAWRALHVYALKRDFWTMADTDEEEHEWIQDVMNGKMELLEHTLIL